MLSVEDWAEIRQAVAPVGPPISEIARVMGISRNTVKSALACDGPPKYQRAAKGRWRCGRAADQGVAQVYPRMPATVIAERIGWSRGDRCTLSAKVAELRLLYLPPDPAGRTSYVAGEIAQRFLVPWNVVVPVGYGQVPYRRCSCRCRRWCGTRWPRRLIPSRCARRICMPAGGSCFRLWARCPGCWCGTAKARSAGGGPPTGVDRGLPRLPGNPGGQGGDLPAADPGSQGFVERFHDYLEQAFPAWPRLHFARGLQPPNCRTGWCGPTIASIGSWGAGPADRVAADTGDAGVAAGSAEHRVAKLDLAAAGSLHPPGCQRLLVHPSVVGRRIEIVADLDRVRVFSGGAVVADHDRVWAKTPDHQ